MRLRVSVDEETATKIRGIGKLHGLDADETYGEALRFVLDHEQEFREHINETV